MKTLLLATAALSIAALPVAAAAQDAAHAYGSIGYGQVKTDQATLGVVTGRAGWKFTPNIAVEGEASIGVEDDAFDVSIDGVSGVYELKHDFAAYAVGVLPLGDHFELFARVGYGTTSIEASAPSVTALGDGESLNYGLGANAFLGDNGLRADWTRRDYQDNGGEADVWSVSYVRRF